METPFAKLYKQMNGQKGNGSNKHAAFISWYKKNVAQEPELTDQQRIQMLRQRIEELKKSLWLKNIPEEHMPNAY